MIGAAEQLHGAARVVSSAVLILRLEQPTFEAFLKEARGIETVGAILDPTLYNSSERRAVSAVLEPLFQAAIDFIAAYDAHVARAQAALEVVNRETGAR